MYNLAIIYMYIELNAMLMGGGGVGGKQDMTHKSSPYILNYIISTMIMAHQSFHNYTSLDNLVCIYTNTVLSIFYPKA